MLFSEAGGRWFMKKPVKNSWHCPFKWSYRDFYYIVSTSLVILYTPFIRIITKSRFIDFDKEEIIAFTCGYIDPTRGGPSRWSPADQRVDL